MKQKERKNPMEVLWICMAAVCLIIAVLRTIQLGFDEGIVMYIASAVSVCMFMWRRALRKRDENEL
ncbi:MAG: hypothetical protein J5882_01515 [Bacteroidales bacterium]|nr:hypothetical protein [Bacteroidales bacterium]